MNFEAKWFLYSLCVKENTMDDPKIMGTLASVHTRVSQNLYGTFPKTFII